ncbi:response regulator transcription factor [Hymenobacter sp. BT683]|uniref:Response regulator transcription factor n=1 Tax=Hymenobacter jeongseonensis TaxID=2791027 RepID=A0ABS0IMN3_9BACT|nr:LytTR family DNA-binding domain-containing protein [Hymenobacter jeongseonensis]MBF9239626.1 response regulator transcription factor [Hymenobacter jeongseonensis]
MNAIVLDDEPVALDVIRQLVAEVPFVRVARYFTSPFDAAGFLQQNSIDLLFLDIKMPGISGVDLLKTLSRPPLVIFTTAHSEHAVHSFELNALDYLLKPFSQARFLQACNRAQEQYKLKNAPSRDVVPTFVFVKSGSQQVRVELSEVLYAESVGNYVQFVLTTQRVVSRLTMNEAMALLPSSVFLRVHRSFVVAKQQVTKADRRSVWVQRHELPIGATYAQEVDDFIQLHRIN